MREHLYRFVFKHDINRSIEYKIFSLQDLIDGMEEDLLQVMCDCKPEGESNFLDCDCEDYLEYFRLIHKDQWTGLKDKNGVKVFEGDKFDDIDADDEGSYFVIEYCEVKARFIAMLYGYGEYINENGGEELNTYISALDDCILDPEDLLDQEIIGNIHSEAKG